jgi:CHAT domain-containing protein/Tfp pilus assembly protein PilF
MPPLSAQPQPSVTSSLTPAQRERLKGRDRLKQEARSLSSAGHLNEAVAATEKVLAIERDVFGSQHPDVAGTLSRLADLQEQREHFDAARQARKETLAIRMQLHGAGHWETIDARLAAAWLERMSKLPPAQRQRLRDAARLNAQVNRFGDEGKIDEALPMAVRALEIRKEILGEEDVQTAESLNNLGWMYREKFDYARAEPLFRHALELRKKLLGEKHPDYGETLNSLGWMYYYQDQYDKAEVYFQQALPIYKEAGHRDYGVCLNNLGTLYGRTGRYAKAEPYFREAVELRKRTIGEKDPAYAVSLVNLGWIYYEQADYARAELLYLQAFQIRKEVMGNRSAAYAKSLKSLATLYIKMSEYPKAERLLSEAADVEREVLGEKNPDYATTLDDLAVVYEHIGDYAKAEPLCRQALEIRKKTLGEAHRDYADSLVGLATENLEQGEYSKAEPLLRQALEIDKKTLGEAHPRYARDLHDLACMYWRAGDWAKAEPLFRQVLEIRKKTLGEAHPNYAITLRLLAWVYAARGEYARAEPLCRQALDICRTTLGEAHPNYAISLNYLALLHFKKGEYGRAESLSRRANELVLGHLEASAAGEAEQTQFRHGAKWRWYLPYYLRNAEKARTSAADAYAQLLTWKGVITVRQRLTRLGLATLDKDPDSEPARLFRELQTISRQLTRLTQANPDPRKLPDLRQEIQKALERREQIEARLAGMTAEFRRLRESRGLKPADLQRLLPPQAALIDFLEYGEKNSHLVVFVVTSKEVQRVDFSDWGATRVAVDAFRATLARRSRPVMGKEDPAVVLRDKLWRPIAAHLDGVKLVLVSPDGALTRLPFAALPGADGKFLLEDLTLAVLPVPRLLPELLAKRDPGKADAPPSLLVLGDVDFDAAPAGRRETTVAASWQRRRAGERMEWRRLQGTRGELLAIEDTFHKAVPEGKLTVLRGEQAQEASLRRLAPRHEYLHLATHGFFAPKELKSVLQASPPEGARGGAEGAVAVGYHPGLLSGLVLAGANRPTEDTDGVLTALEVAELDLSKVELAVLSACDTGLGEVAGGEGVLGLQRAFQVAGTRTTVTSLWKVDDEATRLLMERFYENYWKKGLETLEALTEAQRWLLKEGVRRDMSREDGEAHDPKDRRQAPPYYWAAFVLSGDWR